jgi:hypothetical protein
MVTLLGAVFMVTYQQGVLRSRSNETLPFKRYLGIILSGLMVTMCGCGVLKPIDKPSLAGDSSRPGKVFATVYHDFDDILVPKAMQVNRKVSSVFETATITAGVLSLNGSLKVNELIAFFNINMIKDNWTAVGMFRGPRSIMHFAKGNRWCVVTLTDGRYGYKTQVDIWVTPKNDATPTGLLK